MAKTEDEMAPRYEDVKPLDGYLASDEQKAAWRREEEASQKRILGVRLFTRVIDWLSGEPPRLEAGNSSLNITDWEENNPVPLSQQQEDDIDQVVRMYEDYFGTDIESSEEEVTSSAAQT